jgi:CubicO group peptidase (beta-lactamase class C family)
MNQNTGTVSKIVGLLLGLNITASFAVTNTASQMITPLTWQQVGLMQGFPPAESQLVTKANFTQPPYNRWAFQHMRYLNFTAPINRGNLAVSQFGTESVNVLDQTFVVAGKNYKLKDLLEQNYTDGFIIIHNDKIISEYYADGLTPDTPHWIASMTKSVIGTVAELLIYRGLLDPTKKVAFYIPELKNSPYGKATVREVLDMNVAVQTDGHMDNLLQSGSYYNNFAKAVGFFPSAEIVDVYKLLPQPKALGHNGGQFRYASSTAEVAGWLISRVTNKPTEEVISEEIWSKLGTSGDAYTIVGPTSKMVSTGGLNVTLRDYARFGMLIANNGKVNGQQVLPKAVIERITGGGDPKSWEAGEYANLKPLINSYHSYWYQTDNKNHAVMAMGIYGQYAYIDPTDKTVIVKFGSLPAQIMDNLENPLLAVFPQIAQQVNEGNSRTKTISDAPL